MNLEDRSKYLTTPVTLNAKPARISGTALRLAEVVTTERDYKGNFIRLRIPWSEAIRIIEQEGGNFYGGKRYISAEERKRYAVGFVIGALGVIFILTLIEIFSR
jgi:hypothetical protein